MQSAWRLRWSPIWAILWLALPALHATEAIPASAREEDPVLQGLVAEAFARHPDLAAARAAIGMAATRPAAAGALPDPMVGVLYTNDGWRPTLGSEDMSTLALMASQDLTYPGKRALRRSVAEADEGLAVLALERVELSVRAAVSRAYYALAAARQTAVLVEERLRLWRQVEEAALSLYAAGSGAQVDVPLAQIEGTRIQEAREAARLEVQIRLAELNALLVRDVETPIPTPDTIVAAPRPDEAAQLAEAEKRSPELRAAERTVRRDEIAVSLARREFKPDFSVQAAYMNRGGLPAMWQAGVTASVPRSRVRQRAGLAEAEARLRQGQARLQSLRLRLRARTQERLLRLGSNAQVQSLYRESLLPQRRLAVDSTLAGYRAGISPLTAVLGALSSMVQDRAAQVQLAARAAVLHVSLHEMSLNEDGSGSEMSAGAPTAWMPAGAPGGISSSSGPMGMTGGQQ